MFEFIRDNQLNLMLQMSAVSATISILLVFTKALPKRRKAIMILIELIATFLLIFDRQCYLYSGDTSALGSIMVRFSNFAVFFLTALIVFAFNLYLIDLLNHDEKKITFVPLRLKIVFFATLIGMLLVIVSQFTGWYYYFDEFNKYQRGPLFPLSYAVPILCPLLQFAVMHKNRKRYGRMIYYATLIYIFVPITCGVIQYYVYGISIINISLVAVSLCFYIFTYLDLNAEVEHAHDVEMEDLKKDRRSMKRLFDQTANAFVAAVEKKNTYLNGHSARTAQIARRIASEKGMTEEQCDEIYYTALLHNIGMVGLPDSLLEKGESLSEEEQNEVKKMPELSAEILSSITEYSYLSNNARDCFERYDGSGFPKGKKGNDIPEAARIVAVAEAYDSMTMKTVDRDPLPRPFVREEFIKDAGVRFDPEYAEIMVHLLDTQLQDDSGAEANTVEKEIECAKYRTTVSSGIPIVRNITNVRFRCKGVKKKNGEFSMPSLILFDSYDRRVHNNAKAIEAYHYYEYAELWFDGHSISTGVRNMEVKVSASEMTDSAVASTAEGEAPEKGHLYEITAARCADHVKLVMKSAAQTVEAILALPDQTKSCYIGLTGEHCIICEIKAEQTEEKIAESDIPRIADPVSYTNRMETDLPNLQIDRTRSVSSEGIPVTDGLRLEFHTMSLPTATLVWHCPYIVLFYSKDKKVGGEDYREYALVKLNGESDPVKEHAENRFVMKKKDTFPGWNAWKKLHQSGVECKVTFARKGNRITLYSENAGISIENITRISDDPEEVYVALTGDQVALTDIRIK